jgi:hypothetical protein
MVLPTENARKTREPQEGGVSSGVSWASKRTGHHRKPQNAESCVTRDIVDYSLGGVGFLIRAGTALQAGGRRFETCTAHNKIKAFSPKPPVGGPFDTRIGHLPASERHLRGNLQPRKDTPKGIRDKSYPPVGRHHLGPAGPLTPSLGLSFRAARTGNRFLVTAGKNNRENNSSAEILRFISPNFRELFPKFGIFSSDSFDSESQCRLFVDAQQLEDKFLRSRPRHTAFGRDAKRGPYLGGRGDPPPCSFDAVRIVDKP